MGRAHRTYELFLPGGRLRLGLLSVAVIFLFTLSSSIDEGVLALIVAAGGNVGWWLTFVQFLAFLLPAVPSRLARTKGPQGGGILSGITRWHVLCGTMVCLSHGLVNVASLRINYSTATLFKSCKILSLIVAGVFIRRRRLALQALVFGGLLCLGLYTFTVAEHMSKFAASMEAKAGRPKRPLPGPSSPKTALRTARQGELATSRYDPVGILLLCLALSMSGVLNQLQEWLLHSSGGAGRSDAQPQQPKLASPAADMEAGTSGGLSESGNGSVSGGSSSSSSGSSSPSTGGREGLIFGQYLIASSCLLGLCVLTGELHRGLHVYMNVLTRRELGLLFLSMAINSVGLRVVFVVVEEYGTTTAGIVVTLRKIVTFATSFLLYPKPFTRLHAVGFGMALGGAFLLERHEARARAARKRRARHQSDALPAAYQPRVGFGGGGGGGGGGVGVDGSSGSGGGRVRLAV